MTTYWTVHTMELTLTGASLLSDNPKATSLDTTSSHTLHSDIADHHHHDDHEHNSHNHNCHRHGGAALGRIIGTTAKLNDATTLLPTKEEVQRFKTDKPFCLSVLSNVARGGTYEIFLNLVTILVINENNGKRTDTENHVSNDGVMILKVDDHIAVADMLNGYGADGHTLAHWCTKRGDDPRFLKFLISKSYISPNGSRLLIDLHLPSKDSVGMYPLHWAVTEGAIPLVSMLLQHLEDRPSPAARSPTGSDLMRSSSSLMMGGDDEDNSPKNVTPNIGIDAKDSSGCTPLLIASQYGHPNLAAFLIKRGADPNAIDSNRDSALHWAAYKGSVEVCGMLLHLQGVEGKLDEIDAFGQTPLHLASLRGNIETVRFLMEEATNAFLERKNDGGKSTLGKGSAMVGRVGSKLQTSIKSSSSFPAKLLLIRDKENKTPLDLAIKKKKVGCELILQEYHEKYLAPRRSFISRAGRSCRDIFSIRNWKAWMGMGGSELPIGQNPTFPFYWMTANLLMAGIFYIIEFIGVGAKRRFGDDGLVWDRLGLHFFFMISWILTWITLYFTYRTNPGVLDARGLSYSSTSASYCQLFCYNTGGYSKDKISVKMAALTKELRRQYDDVIESFSKDCPSDETKIPLCHTCRIVKPLRSKHCRVTRRCVLFFDHHCPFVGTTIGLYNYIYFYLFLIFFLVAEICFIIAWFILLNRSKSFPKANFLVGGYFLLYIIPVFMMVFYHTQLVLNNMSTNEQLNLRKYRYFWTNGQFWNPFDQGMIHNILQRLSPDQRSYEIHHPCEESEEVQAMLSSSAV